MSGDEKLDTAIFADLLGIYGEMNYKNDIEWEEIKYRNGLTSKNVYISNLNTIRSKKEASDKALTDSIVKTMGEKVGKNVNNYDGETISFTKEEVEMIDKMIKATGATVPDRKRAILGCVNFFLSLKDDEEVLKNRKK